MKIKINSGYLYQTKEKEMMAVGCSMITKLKNALNVERDGTQMLLTKGCSNG